MIYNDYQEYKLQNMSDSFSQPETLSTETEIFKSLLEISRKYKLNIFIII